MKWVIIYNLTRYIFVLYINFMKELRHIRRTTRRGHVYGNLLVSWANFDLWQCFSRLRQRKCFACSLLRLILFLQSPDFLFHRRDIADGNSAVERYIVEPKEDKENAIITSFKADANSAFIVSDTTTTVEVCNFMVFLPLSSKELL